MNAFLTLDLLNVSVPVAVLRASARALYASAIVPVLYTLHKLAAILSPPSNE